MPRSLALLLIFCCISFIAKGQEPLLPAQHGGDLNKVLDLRDPTQNTIRKTPEFDFARDNPGIRNLPPLSRKCVTVEVQKEQSAEHAESGETEAEFEDWIEQSIQRSQQKSRSLRRRGPDIYNLPVVVHVVYSSPTENISDEQIFSQLEVLNNDYRLQNADVAIPEDFEDVAADTEISFCLANIDPNGLPSTGINRVSVSGAPFTENYVNEVIKPNTIWDPNRYMNIWVCNLSGGILGFAQFPNSSGLTGIPNGIGTANTDGVVVNYLAFGTTGTAASPFDGGRTLTHEVGHWLGLRHIWGDGPCSFDDFCLDTPPTAQAHFSCQTEETFACDGTVAMVQNFMDYSDDACMSLFTRDQKQRMRAVLENSPRRKSLLSSPVCKLGQTAMEPDFIVDLQAGCAPHSVNLRHLLPEGEENEVLSYKWSFPGGRPSSSSKENPKVTYKKPGRYNVSLRIQSPGGALSIEKNAYIRVYSQGVGLPVEAQFENTQVADGFYFYNPQDDLGWGQSQLVGGNGQSQGSLKMANFDNNHLNSADWLLTPIMDFGTATKSSLSFDVAYGFFEERYSDSLGVFISTDCDGVFRNIYYKGGEALSTQRLNAQTEFVPQASEWRREVIDLSGFDQYEFVQIAFVNFSGYGNNLYLDNISIAGIPKPAPEANFTASQLEVCPGDSVRFSDISSNDPRKWVWTFPGGFPASDTSANPVVVYPKSGVYDVVLTVSNRNGSNTLTRNAQIRVGSTPELKLLANKTEICPGEAVELKAEGAQQVIWDLGDQLVGPEQKSVIVQPITDQTYKIRAQDGFACSTTAEISIRVEAGRELQITPPNATICEGTSLTLNATGADQYRWVNAPGLVNNNSGQIEVRPLTTTVYTVLGSTRNGCQLEKSITVNVKKETDLISIQAERKVVCPGQSVQLKAKGAASYRWSPAIGLNTTEGSTVIASPNGPTTYTLNAVTENGCVSESQIRLEMGEKPNVTAFATAADICEGEAIQLIANGGLRYRWSPDTDLSQNTGRLVDLAPKQNTLFQVVGEADNGCSDTAQVQVNVYQPSQITISPQNPSICPGRSVILTASGGSSYTWTPNDGLNANYRAQVAASPSQTTRYQVSAIDERGCQSTTETTVTVSEGLNPLADFSAEEFFVCAGAPLQFINKSQNAADFLWEFQGAEIENSREANPVVRFTQQGVFNVKLTATACNGVSDTKESVAMIVVTAPINLSLNAVENITVCKGSPFKLEVEPEAGVSYRWSPDIGLDQTEGSSVMASPDITTTYTLTAVNQDGCRAEEELTLSVVGTGSKLKVSPANPSICLGESVTLSASGAYNYQWYPKDGLTVSDEPVVIAKPNKSRRYFVEATDLNGCVFRDTIRVEVKSLPEINFAQKVDTLCEGQQTSLVLQGEAQYSWSPAYGLSTTNGKEVVAFPKESITYTINATNEQGCKTEAKLPITVKAKVQLSATTQDEVICQGTATLLTAQAVGYNYNWSPAKGLDKTTGGLVTARPEETTTYTLSVEDISCVIPANVTVEVKKAEPLSIEPAAARICEGQSIGLMASGGKAYTWDAAEGLSTVSGPAVMVFPKATSSYTVRAQDSSGCESQASVTIIVNKEDFLTASASVASVCLGEEVTLLASGAEGYEWQASPGLEMTRNSRVYVTPEDETTFTVIGVNKVGCLDTASITVGVSSLRPEFSMVRDQSYLAP
ncbi:MAG: PKD domain-containing protein [Bacteroidota bacterium]